MTAVPVLALGADILAVLVFAAVGRHTHAESDGVVGVLVTAWPFLVGVAVGWLVALGSRRRAPRAVADAFPVWLATVVVGMVVRHAAGRGTPVAFVIVATLVLGLFLFGWRELVALRARSGHT
jgi:Protein of unknown function (DUF3054)